MAFSIHVLHQAVNGLLGQANAAEIPRLDRYRQIRAAVSQYSIDRPDVATADITGDGGRYYPVSGNLAAWSDQLSHVIRIEYPAYALSSDQQPQYLAAGDYDDAYYDAAGARYIFFNSHSPSSSETIRVTYLAPYTWTASSTDTLSVSQEAHGFSEDNYIYETSAGIWTAADNQEIATHQVTAVADVDNFTAAALETPIPVAHFEAIVSLAAALCCDAIATKYARTSDSSISADSVDHAGRSARFETRAREYRRRYTAAVTAGDDRPEGQQVQPAGGFVDWHKNRSAQWLTHRRGRRW